MRGHRALIAIGAVLAVVVAAAVVAVLRWPHDPADDDFEVSGQTIDCRATGVVALEVAVFYPGPAVALMLDGEPLDSQHPGGDPYELRPDRPLRFSCADNKTHRIQIVGRRNLPDADSCQISLVSPLEPIPGKDVRPRPAFDANEFTCDLTWTDQPPAARRSALDQGTVLWTARPVEEPGPARLEAGNGVSLALDVVSSRAAGAQRTGGTSWGSCAR